MGPQLLRRAAPGVVAIVGALVIAGPAGGVAGAPAPPVIPPVAPPPVSLPDPVSLPEVPAPVLPVESPPVSLPELPPAPTPAPSVPQLEAPAELEAPAQLEPVPDPQSPALSEAAEPESATASPPPSVPSPPDGGGVAQTPSRPENGSASPSSPARSPSAGLPVGPGRDRAGSRHRLDADRKLRATVEELSGCLYAIPLFERGVLRLRTGLGGKKGLSRAQVARRLNASRAGVRRAERRGVRGLRRAARTGGCGSSSAGSAGSSVGLTIPVLATVGGAIAGEPLAALNDLEARQHAGGRGAVAGFQETGGTRGEDGRSQSTAPASAAERDRSPWLLIFLALVLGGLTLLGAAIARTGRGRRQAAQLSCAFCSSKRVATNPIRDVYRCADCGFSAQLAGAPQAEAGKMDGVAKRS